MSLHWCLMEINLKTLFSTVFHLNWIYIYIWIATQYMPGLHGSWWNFFTFISSCCSNETVVGVWFVNWILITGKSNGEISCKIIKKKNDLIRNGCELTSISEEKNMIDKPNECKKRTVYKLIATMWNFICNDLTLMSNFGLQYILHS